MKIETHRPLGFLLLLLLLLAATLAGGSLFSASKADAERGSEGIGRYQIAAWGSYSGGRVHHSGYFVLDTVTGKVVDKGHAVHGIEGTGPPD